ncbi:Integrase core domain protein [Tepidimonas aquatica]|uniref:Integrase core domain protein n=1 Tax=Tepidimonas aquatica TaxID=247482 RepID=A0A554WCA6_9BURK|nr:Integrase core domain protein [Tepidimonas aquatica]
MTRLHKLARTTPAIRAEIHASNESCTVLAKRYGISPMTVLKWKRRTDFEGRPHTAHRLPTTLTRAQEAIAVRLRKTLLLSLDDLLSVMREFVNPDVSRSGLDRCLRRHGVGNLRQLLPAAPKSAHKPFKAYEPGFVHIDVKYLPQMADGTQHRYLFVAIERATRWVFVQLHNKRKSAGAAKRFLADLIKASPIKIHTILTDNGKAFTDRFITTGERTPTGQHAFDALCAALHIEHRLTPPRRPQTNGMDERFNGRIEEVLRSHHFVSGQDLEQTLLRYVALYNHHLPQAALKGQTPLQAMKDWHRQRPALFHKKPYDRPGYDSHAYASRSIRAPQLPFMRVCASLIESLTHARPAPVNCTCCFHPARTGRTTSERRRHDSTCLCLPRTAYPA